MGVIKQTPRRALDPASGNTSDNETNLAIPTTRNTSVNSSHEDLTLLSSLNNLQHQQRRIRLRLRVPAIPVDTTPARNRKPDRASCRKLRRYENQLLLIQEEEDGEGEVSIEDLTSNNQTARTFTRFLNEAVAENGAAAMADLFNAFIDSPDETSNTMGIGDENCKRTKNEGQRTHPLDPETAFLGICRKLRNILKQRHVPLGIVDNLEQCVISHFSTPKPEDKDTTDEELKLGPLDAYRRGLLHAISQYNNLKSYSVGKKKTEKIVHVQNVNEDKEFRPPPIRLVSYIETKLHNNQNVQN